MPTPYYYLGVPRRCRPPNMIWGGVLVMPTPYYDLGGSLDDADPYYDLGVPWRC